MRQNNLIGKQRWHADAEHQLAQADQWRIAGPRRVADFDVGKHDARHQGKFNIEDADRDRPAAALTEVSLERAAKPVPVEERDEYDQCHPERAQHPRPAALA